MSCHDDIDDGARLDRRREPYLRELLGAAELARFGEHVAPGADLAVEMATQCVCALVAQEVG